MLLFFYTKFTLVNYLAYLGIISFLFVGIAGAVQRDSIEDGEKIILPFYRAPRLKQEDKMLPVKPEMPTFENLCLSGKLFSHGICSRGSNILIGSTEIIGSLSLTLKKLKLKGHLIVCGNICATGNICAKGNVCAKSFLTLSDGRLKKDIIDLASGHCLDTILGLAPKEFYFTSEAQQVFGCATKKQKGFIAQEVELVIPQAVSVDTEQSNLYDEIHTLEYDKLIPDLVGALQECHKKILYLEERLESLEQVKTNKS